jgi:hypothetical protein
MRLPKIDALDLRWPRPPERSVPLPTAGPLHCVDCGREVMVFGPEGDLCIRCSLVADVARDWGRTSIEVWRIALRREHLVGFLIDEHAERWLAETGVRPADPDFPARRPRATTTQAAAAGAAAKEA